jgi:ATP-dependent RNA helicase DeaD
VEAESHEPQPDTGVARSQHVVHIAPDDPAIVAALLEPSLERLEQLETPASPQVLVVVPTADLAVSVAAALHARRVPGPALLAPITSARRAPRLLVASPAAIVGSVSDLLALVRSAHLKLDQVRAVTLAFGNGLFEHVSDVEQLLGEIPRDAERTLIVQRVTPEIDAFLDRQLWRARKVPRLGPAADVPLQYAVVTAAQRGWALRRVLDELDPASAVVVVSNESAAREASAAVHALGYSGADDAPVRVRVAREAGGADATDLVVLFDLPPDAAALKNAVGTSSHVIALVQPNEAETFRAIAGAAARAVNLSAAVQHAHAREETLRRELRSVVRTRALTREIAALEPLLDELDAVEVAAAALRLLDDERARARRHADERVEPLAAPRAAAPQQPPSQHTRVFLNVGERDGVRRGDIVGAITGEAGITGSQLGRIDLRESHAIVDVMSDVAPRVIERLTGATIRGRRVIAKVDTHADAGSARGHRRDSGERGDREHRDRPERADRYDRGDRGGQSARRPREEGEAREEGRSPRAMNESQEWSERAERLRNARGRRPEGE